MTEPTTTRPPAEREFVLGREFRGTILTSAAETDGRHDITYGVQPPGAATPLHMHTGYDERFFVVSGSLHIRAGDETVTLHAGDFYAIPKNTPHVLRAGPDGARSLNISSPARFAELLARTGTPASRASADVMFDAERFASVSSELGDVVLGPTDPMP